MRVRFLLNGEVRDVEAAPSRLLLGWLREEAGLVGTKEGCGEGDCGACMVAVGDLDEAGSLRWRAVNACILFLGQVNGKAVLTVEGVADADGTLHPVQRALVEHHASQCGFCTPGFVMTLFAHWWHRGPCDRARLDDLLAGNLCRCTGYRPILDAARAMAGLPGGDRHLDAAGAIAEQLRTWAAAPSAGEGFVAPRSVDELASQLAAHPEALLLAGGTDAGLWVTKDLRSFDLVVSLAEIPELRRIEVDDGHLRIGAGASYTDLLPHVAEPWPAFGDLLRRLGSEPIRNSATLGGNLGSASPIGDTLPVLLALEATLVLRHGPRRWRLPAAEFFLGYKRTALPPGGFVERIDLPLPAPDLALHVVKVSKRHDQDISAVLLATAVRHDGLTIRSARIGVGGMAATPKRALAAEAALTGAPLEAASFARAAVILAGEFQPLTDMRATAAYRRRAAEAALLEAGDALMGRPVRLPTAPLEPVA